MSASNLPLIVPIVRPFFDRVAELVRSINGQGRSGSGTISVDDALKAITDEITAIVARKNGAKDSSVASLLRDDDPILKDLRTFATWMLCDGSSQFARDMKIRRRREDDGDQDQRFFDQARNELKAGTGSAQRLVIYAICLGLGYTGAHEAGAAEVTQLRNDIWARVKDIIREPREQAKVTFDGEEGPVEALFPDAYKVSKANLFRPPVRWGLVYVAATLALAATVTTVALVATVGDDLKSVLNAIIAKSNLPPQPESQPTP